MLTLTSFENLKVAFLQGRYFENIRYKKVCNEIPSHLIMAQSHVF